MVRLNPNCRSSNRLICNRGWRRFSEYVCPALRMGLGISVSGFVPTLEQSRVRCALNSRMAIAVRWPQTASKNRPWRHLRTPALQRALHKHERLQLQAKPRRANRTEQRHPMRAMFEIEYGRIEIVHAADDCKGIASMRVSWLIPQITENASSTKFFNSLLLYKQEHDRRLQPPSLVDDNRGLALTAKNCAFFARAVYIRFSGEDFKGCLRSRRAAFVPALCVRGETMAQQVPGSWQIAPCLQRHCQPTHDEIRSDHASR